MLDDIYDRLLDQAVQRALETAPTIETERAAASQQLSDLLALPARDREMVLSTTPGFHTYSLARLALETSEKAIFYDPQLALTLARLARSIAFRLDPRACGGKEAIVDLEAYALAEEGNVHRVHGDMAVALAAFGRSRELQKRGGMDLDLILRIDLLESSLRRDLRQIETTVALLDQVIERALELGDRDRWIRAQINRANLFLVQEELDEAALILEGLGEVSDPRMTLSIRHNLASVLATAGQPQEARRIFEETHELYVRFSDPLSANRRLWLEGAIAKGLGQEERAERLWQDAGADLAERGYAFDAALIRLDLGKLQARRRAEPVC